MFLRLTLTLRYYAACCCSAICALHERGIIHRFANLQSFCITAEGTIKLIDLRYARRMEGNKVFTVCGDALYFAPEMVAQTGYDFGIDLWSLGVTLYEIYEERIPFGDASTAETEVFKSITSFNAASDLGYKKAPTEMQAVISKLLNNSPKQRLGYNNADDLCTHMGFGGSRANPAVGHPLRVDVEVDSESLEALRFDFAS